MYESYDTKPIQKPIHNFRKLQNSNRYNIGKYNFLSLLYFNKLSDNTVVQLDYVKGRTPVYPFL